MIVKFCKILSADLERFSSKSRIKSKLFQLFTLQGAWGVFVYRLGNISYQCSKRNKLYLIIIPIWWILNKFIEIVTGISIDFRAQIGKGFIISHFGPVIISRDAVIGENFGISQGVTIGRTSKGVPKIGNNVYIGANAVLIGDIFIGDNSKIGALALVNKSFPENSIIVGNPAINKSKTQL